MMHFLALFALATVAFPAGLRAADQDGGMTTRLLLSPWDANAWEPGAGVSFWRAGAAGEKPEAASPTEAAAPRPTDSEKTAPPATASPESATKPDFSNRQPEK